ncbi:MULTISPECIES: hypothetical protein [unclassified Mesorhizobium]|uniref:hypothetical protein n=1 Tax=unclassified Mesorhizobium TaxID=325217 RepID=UPI00112979F1|nr:MULTISPECIES: hypothetical protein [unclassified Mesorhizobium]MBZ9982504.1 hypothetical protein [Mesorhizobium sp. BR-1-1-8]TPL32241.1 hypothetical protein FJ947_22435 [Mesorhizobium sp. B2-4-8]TPL61180.1 hypothetical protein FJ949_23925 [Mesorhizobium sp. B2-4-1]
MEFLPTKDGPCLDFIVVPPIGTRFDDSLLLTKIEDGLNSEFTGFRFVVTADGLDRSQDFLLIPVFGVLGEHTYESIMRAAPDLETCRGIAIFLCRYQIGGLTMH